jgi:hypothetical protein
MDYWFALGIFLAGCGIGALLTAAVYLSQLKKIKTDLHRDFDSDSQNPSPISSNRDKGGAEKRSA